MKKLIVFILCLPFFSFAQSVSKYWISFTDKNNSAYSISNPSAFLSSKSISRRQKYNIQITTDDLPVNASYIDSVKSKGAKIMNASKWLNGVSIELQDTSKLGLIRALPFVKKTEFVAYRKSKRVKDEKYDTEIPFSKFNQSLASQKLSGFNYGASAAQINMLNGVGLHNSGYDGRGIVIALLDAGFYKVDVLSAFDSLRSNNQILGVKDFVNGDHSVYEDDNHGMMVLSTIAGNIPGSIVGTAPKAEFYLLRTEDVFSEYLIEEYNWVAGAEYADSVGVDIISSSLGYTEFDDASQNHTYVHMDGNTCPSTIGADIAASRGILVFVSAGNQGNSSWKYISAPSDGDSVVSVAAVNPFGVRASFSSVGPSYDRRIKPNLAATGESAVVADEWGGIQLANGTSFACPILAGMSACLLQAHSGMSNMDIIQALQQSGNQFANPDSLLGYGIPDFNNAHAILTSVDENYSTSFHMSAYPNPSQSQFLIILKDKSGIKKAEIMIHDIVGRLVKSINIEAEGRAYYEITLNDSDLPSRGIYIVSLKSASSKSYLKLVKQ